MRGSASPKGEARRERAGKAERSDRRAREDYGWGWAGGVTKPNHAPNPIPRPHHTRGSAQPPRQSNPRIAFRRVPVSVRAAAELRLQQIPESAEPLLGRLLAVLADGLSFVVEEPGANRATE